MSELATIKSKFESLGDLMDEKMRRLWAASEASKLGWGGVTLVARATGLNRKTIIAGLKDRA
jgi:hypothetical protein